MNQRLSFIHRKEVKSASDVIRQMFRVLDAMLISYAQLEKPEKMSPGTVSRWRSGIHTPNILTVEAVLSRMGYRLTLEPIDEATSSTTVPVSELPWRSECPACLQPNIGLRINEVVSDPSMVHISLRLRKE